LNNPFGQLESHSRQLAQFASKLSPIRGQPHRKSD
jgi:hypothetical protein